MTAATYRTVRTAGDIVGAEREYRRNAGTAPHVDAAWCHCVTCSRHDEYIASLAERVAAAMARTGGTAEVRVS